MNLNASKRDTSCRRCCEIGDTFIGFLLTPVKEPPAIGLVLS